MSARASARTFSARAWLRAVRERCSHGASTTASPARASVVMAITSRQLPIWPCWAITMPNAAPTRPSPTMTRTSAGQPPRATKAPARPAAGFGPPVLLLRGVGLPPDQSRAGAGEGDRPESCELMPSPLLCTIQSSPTPSATSATSHAPVGPPPGPGLVPHARPRWPPRARVP